MTLDWIRNLVDQNGDEVAAAVVKLYPNEVAQELRKTGDFKVYPSYVDVQPATTRKGVGDWYFCAVCEQEVPMSHHHINEINDQPHAFDAFLKDVYGMEVNERGGRQAHIGVAFHLIDPGALWALATILYHGADNHGVDNWRLIDVDDHLNHAIAHIIKYWQGDDKEDHLGNAFCRLMMAKALQIELEV